MTNFFDFAENGYAYFMHCYKDGMVFNDMAVNAANTVEKYLKHIAMISGNFDLFHMPSWAKDHNIKNLLTEMEERNIISINKATFFTIYEIKQYLYIARYPEYDDSRIVTKKDIDKCKTALVVCRNLTLDYIRLHSATQEIDDVERN